MEGGGGGAGVDSTEGGGGGGGYSGGGEGSGPSPPGGFQKRCTPQRITSAQILLMLKARPKNSPLQELAARVEASAAAAAGGGTSSSFGRGSFGASLDEPLGALGGSLGAPQHATRGASSAAASAGGAPSRSPRREARPGLQNTSGNVGAVGALDPDAGCNCKKSKCLKL